MVSDESRNCIMRSTSYASKTAEIPGMVPAHNAGSTHSKQDKNVYCSLGSRDVSSLRIHATGEDGGLSILGSKRNTPYSAAASQNQNQSFLEFPA